MQVAFRARHAAASVRDAELQLSAALNQILARNAAGEIEQAA
jgi:hypothetical protein